MKYYISIDGGGSKLALLLFDENLHPISYAISAGINPHFYTAAQVKTHCRDCFTKLMKNFPTKRISGIYGADLNGLKNTIRIVSDLVDFEEYVQLSEGLVGLLASGLYPDGIVALSGTGSNVFYLRDGQLVKSSGGLGALLGDDGSGFTIGREGLRFAINHTIGMSETTALTKMLPEFLHIQEAGYESCDLVKGLKRLYDEEHPVARIASFSRQVGQAAYNGDKIALNIAKNAGITMAEQVLNVIRRLEIPPNVPICTIGGAYKTHPIMLESFKHVIRSGGTGHIVNPNLFEPIVGGVLYRRIHENNCISNEDLILAKQHYCEHLYTL